MVKILVAMDLVPAINAALVGRVFVSLSLPRKMGLSHAQHLAAAAVGKEVDWVSDEYWYSL